MSDERKIMIDEPQAGTERVEGDATVAETLVVLVFLAFLAAFGFGLLGLLAP